MDAGLPPDADLGNALRLALRSYKKRAKELKRALAGGDERARARLVAHHPKFRRRGASAAKEVSLADAQLVIAREHGRASWKELRQAVASGEQHAEASPSDQLLAAVRGGKLDVVRELCARHSGLAALPDSKGVLPLVEAADRGLRDIAAALLDAGADPNAGDAVLAAAHAGPHKREPALDVVELLVARGAPDDVFLHATLGRIERLRAEIGRVDLEARGPASSTPLFLAAWNGQVEAVRLLLDAGAEPNPICRQGQSAWQVVFMHSWSPSHRRVAELLLERGVSCTLHEACTLSHHATVRRLLAERPELKDQRNDRGLTALDIAVLNADVELARLLLAAGAADPKGQGGALARDTRQSERAYGGALFRGCSFHTANFHDCTLENATFSNVNMCGVRVDNVNLSGARIDNAFIRGLTIYGIEVEPLLMRELELRSKRKARAR